MKTAYVIGATGHVGCYMVPALVDAGYEVTAISRGKSEPYTKDMPQWQKVKRVAATRDEAIKLIAGDHPDVVCDLICYTEADAKLLCESLYNTPGNENVRLISIGSVWIVQEKYYVPVDEEHIRNAKDEYGHGKVEMSAYLSRQYKEKGLKVTILHPGHICGKGWMPVGPQGTRDPQVIRDIMNGKELKLPDPFGQITLHHVHSADIASLAIECINNDKSLGEEFFITCPKPITMYGFAMKLYEKYGQKPNLKFVPYTQLKEELTGVSQFEYLEHVDRSPCASMDKAKRILGFEPAYDEWATLEESIDSMNIKP